jgi:PAS domain-containing protein
VTATIAYDRHVENLIDELSATGHVTHTKYQKKSVTLHHNGGVRFSHQTILNIWRSRPASAHFDADAAGDIAQYVEAHEYAWAVGNTRGNCETISIEMANLTGAPSYEVGEATWRSAARLAGWLFAHVIHARPTTTNFFLHQHWSATACPGPFVKAHYGEILRAAQAAYDQFVGPHPAPSPAPAANPVSAIQRAVEVPVDGKWGTATDFRVRLMRAACLRHLGYPNNAGVSFDIRTAQRIVDSAPDGVWGPATQGKLVDWLKGFQRILGVTPDGRWGPATEKRFSQIRDKHLIR